MLYLHCVICSRKQADGLLSGSAWGRIELPAGSAIQHPSVKGSTARACPTCVGQYTDWQDRGLVILGVSTNGPSPASATA